MQNKRERGKNAAKSILNMGMSVCQKVRKARLIRLSSVSDDFRKRNFTA
jgi:hypothetical protein